MAEIWIDEFGSFDWAAVEARFAAMEGKGMEERELAASAYYVGGQGGAIVASYPPIKPIKQPETMTATEARQAQDGKVSGWDCVDRMIDQLEAEAIRHTSRPRGAFEPYAELELSRAYATLKAKEDIIAGLQDEINFLRARGAAAETGENRALGKAEEFKAERDRLIGENEANKAIAAERLTEVDLRNTALSLMAEHNKELKAYTKTLEATVAELSRQLQAAGPHEPRPDARDTSRLGHFGEAQAKQGLALFDRYY